MSYFKNWRCNAYRFSDKRRDYSYQELKDYFYIDGSEVIYCKKDFGRCKACKYYLVTVESYGFSVIDWDSSFDGRVLPAGFDSWTGKEYMKGARHI